MNCIKNFIIWKLVLTEISAFFQASFFSMWSKDGVAEWLINWTLIKIEPAI